MEKNFYIAKSNFTGGRWSPQMKGRFDLPQYDNALEEMKNWVPIPQGGATVAPGSVFVAPAKYHDRITYGAEFEFNNEQTYFLEFGDLYLRFFTSNARIEEVGIAIEDVTDNGAGEIEIEATAHGLSDGMSVSISGVVGTWEANGDWVVANATTDTFTLDGSLFNNAYVSGGSIREIFELVTPYPHSIIRELKFAGEGDTLYIFHRNYATRKLTRVSASVFTIAEVDWTVTPFTNTNITATTLQPQGNTIGSTIVLNSTPGMFNSNSVGVYYAVSGGVVKVTAFTNSTHVSAVVKYVINGATMNNAATTNWAEGAWTPWSAYPIDGEFYENRLVIAGSPTFPLTIWGSKYAPEYENFSLGSALPGDGFRYDLRSRHASLIRWVVGDDLLFVGASGREFKVTGADNSAITPTSILARPQAAHGSYDAEPIVSSSGVAFIQRTQKKLRVLRFDLESDKYKAPDATLLSNDILEGNAFQLSYAAEPYDIIYSCLESGTIASLTLLQEQNIQAWATRDTDGLFKSVETIKTAGNDQTWVIVQRSVQGQFRQFVEYFDATIALDCAVKQTFDSPVTSITSGLHHLEGREVMIIGDGAVYVSQTVTHGGLPSALEASTRDIVIGIPFTARMTFFPPGKELPDGYIAGRKFKVVEVMLRVQNSTGISVNGDTNWVRVAEDEMDSPVEPESVVIKFKPDLGWNEPVVITQNLPKPATVLSAISYVVIGD